MGRQRNVFKYFRDGPATIGGLKAEHIRGLAEPWIDLVKGIAYGLRDACHRLAVRHGRVYQTEAHGGVCAL